MRQIQNTRVSDAFLPFESHGLGYSLGELHNIRDTAAVIHDSAPPPSLEKRFTEDEISTMMVAAELGNIRFSERQPFRSAVSQKPKATE